MATTTRMSLEEFLALEETKPYLEFIDGEVIEKVAPTVPHSDLVGELYSLFREYLRSTGEGHVMTEVRHVAHSEGRSYLPDVSVTLADRLPRREELRRGAVEVPPDIVVEVLSPDDRAGRVLDRVDFYLRIGVGIVWLVDPDLEAVIEHRPGGPPALHRPPATIDARPVLRDFTLDLSELFSVLHDPDD